MTEEEGSGAMQGVRSPAGVVMSVTDRELIDRYLASRLDEVTRAQVEARIVADAVFRKEVELTEQLRRGLRELDARGDLSPLVVSPRSFWQQPIYALAASVAVGLLALTSVVLYQQLDRARATAIALAQEMGSLKPSGTSRVEVLRLARTRAAGDEPDLVWSRSGPNAMLELRLDAGAAPGPSYEVVLTRIGTGGDAPVLRVPVAGVSSEGEVVVSVNSAVLQVGDYTIRLTPLEAGDGGATSVFRLQVTE